jgi:hypothetical protein
MGAGHDRSPIKLQRRITKWLADLVVTDEAYWRNGKVHSTGKIELFYKPIVYLFLIVFVGMVLERGIMFHNSSLLGLFVDKVSVTISKPAKPIPEKLNPSIPK